MPTFLCATAIALLSIALPPLAVAQQAERTSDRRLRTAAEFSTGWAGFVDETTVGHTVVGGAARFHLTPRVSVGPEVAYMIGPGTDRDLMLTGNVTVDVLAPSGGTERRLTPFIVAGGGVFQHRQRFFNPFTQIDRNFVHNEGAFTAGGGVRVFVTDRIYVAPEMRIGWELHLRTTVAVGVRVSR